MTTGLRQARREDVAAMHSVRMSQGLERLWLTTDPGTRAQRFYETAGWEFVGNTEKGEPRYELKGEAAS